MNRLREALFALRAFLRGFIGATQLGEDPRRTLCEHGERRGRCC
jgi:hypothetical protein